MPSPVHYDDFDNFDDFLEAVAKEEEAFALMPPLRSYDHCFVSASAKQFLTAITTLSTMQGLRCGSIETGCVLPQIKTSVYFLPLLSGCLLWNYGAEPWLLDISKILKTDVRMIIVHEDSYSELLMLSRYYLEISAGQIVHQIGDPEPPNGFGDVWEEFKGIKKFESMEKFVEHVSQWYVPCDTYWSFAKWEHLAPECLTKEHSEIDGALRLTFKKIQITAEIVGHSNPELEALQALVHSLSKA